MLDEPSTGQDAGAKRLLWRALQEVNPTRAILLTTHSMEEAETLASKVAIMGTRMLATGTLGSLQAAHGGFVSVRAVRFPEISAEEAEALVKEKFEGKIFKYEDRHEQISFKLPHDKRALGSVMKVMESLKGNTIRNEGESGSRAAAANEAAVTRVLQDYTIMGPTLEEVFMDVVRESGPAGGV